MPKKKTTQKGREKKEEVEVLIEDDALSSNRY